MLRLVFLKTLRDMRRSIFWWCVGMVLTALYTILAFPTVRDTFLDLSPYFDNPLFKVFMRDFNTLATIEGYLSIELFSLVLPVLSIIMSIIYFIGVVGREEERGTLELLVSMPMPRWRIALEKVAAVLVAVFFIHAFFWLSLWAGGLAIKVEANYFRIALAILDELLFSLVFGALAFFITGLGKGAGTAGGISGGLASAFYLIEAIGVVSERLKPYRKFSLFYYYGGGRPMVEGLNWNHIALFVGLTVILIAAGILIFQRRDIRVRG